MFLSKSRLEILRKAGCCLNENQCYQIELYVQELALYNPRFSLVKYSSEQELFDNHILDSLLPVSYFFTLNANKWVDVGSGAGLPGVLLAIVMPNKNFTLVERSSRRCQFLQTICLRLKLKNVKVLMTELEKIDEKFDAVVFRAFRSLIAFCPLLKRLLGEKGLLLAYKGKVELSQRELKSISSHFAHTQIKILKTTSQKERCLLVLSKSSS